MTRVLRAHAAVLRHRPSHGLAGGFVSPLQLILIVAMALLVLRFTPVLQDLGRQAGDTGARRPSSQLPGSAAHVDAGPRTPARAVDPSPPQDREMPAAPTPPVPVPPVVEMPPVSPTATAPAKATGQPSPAGADKPAAPPQRTTVAAAVQTPASRPVVTETQPPVAPIAKPAARPVAPPPPPPLRVLVEAEVDDRAGLGEFSEEGYEGLLKRELETVVAAVLGGDALRGGAPNLAFRDALSQGGRAVEALCEQAGAKRLLLADLRIPNEGFSSVDSAYWPLLRLIALDCENGRRHARPQERLEPTYRDRFTYQRDFAQRAERFVASQGYFLKP